MLGFDFRGAQNRASFLGEQVYCGGSEHGTISSGSHWKEASNFGRADALSSHENGAAPDSEKYLPR